MIGYHIAFALRYFLSSFSRILRNSPLFVLRCKIRSIGRPETYSASDNFVAKKEISVHEKENKQLKNSAPAPCGV